MKREPVIVDPVYAPGGTRRPGINHVGRRWLLRAPDGTRELGQRAEPGDQGWYRIRNEASDQPARIDLFDEIGWDVTAGEFIRELTAIDAPAIDVHINSPGGSAWDGFAIYNALVSHPAPIATHIIGVAASAASIVAMAGVARVGYRPSQVMVHRAGSGACVFGNADDMRTGAGEVQAMATSLDQIDAQIIALYATTSGGEVDVWHDAVFAETWYGPDEALAAGLVTSIYGDDTDSPAPGADGASNRADRSHRDRKTQIIRAKARRLHVGGK